MQGRGLGLESPRMVGEVTEGMIVHGEVGQGLTWGSGLIGTGPGYFSWPASGLGDARGCPSAAFPLHLPLPIPGIYLEVKGKS